MTAPTIAAIRERVEKATPGPWDRLANNTIRAIKGNLACPLFEAVTPYDYYRKVYTTHKVMCDAHAAEVNNAEFVLHAREDIPYLLSLLAEAREVVELAGQHVGWITLYADTMTAENWRDQQLRIQRQAEQLQAGLAKLKVTP